MSLETICKCNPWAEALSICHHCADTRRVTSDRDSRDSGPCPYCGTPDSRGPLLRAKNLREMPMLRRSDLTGEEEAQVSDWRRHEFHELDCLRWIEGRRYAPAKDGELLASCIRALRKAHFHHRQAGEPRGLDLIASVNP